MGRAKPKEAGSSRRLSREDWINGAIRLLSEGGLEGLSVNCLADRLCVTKGSFYWHFRDREALLDAVVDTWKRRTTSEIESFIRSGVGTPVGRLRRLVRIAISPQLEVPGGPLEMTLRDWAREDARIAAIVRDVDERRLEFLEKLYRETGCSDAAARSYAVLHMSYVVGSRILLSQRSSNNYAESWRIAERVLIPGIDRTD
jgi:AcrR family transcriptional regulator